MSESKELTGQKGYLVIDGDQKQFFPKRKDAEAAAQTKIESEGELSMTSEPLYVVKAYRFKRPQSTDT